MAETAVGPKLAEIPVGTFRHYIGFIATHDLWNEATAALAAKGIKSVIMGAAEIDVIRAFIDAKGPALNALPEHAGALVVPECSLICRPPVVPKSPFPDGDPTQPVPGNPLPE